MIKDGRFREDLYYRLAEIVVRIPPLAARHGDVTLLANHFLHKFASEMNSQVKGFSPDPLAAINSWGWPGNVRGLANRTQRAVMMADGRLIHAAGLDPRGSERAEDRQGGEE